MCNDRLSWYARAPAPSDITSRFGFSTELNTYGQNLEVEQGGPPTNQILKDTTVDILYKEWEIQRRERASRNAH